ncbi:transcriptional repressor [Geomonas limicola]|uniref:Ferric uptake regulation protein n=1 Tax=Geomonas limicola TaxID=2740186 RepID=A0A6V8ND23_9BACT|nr:Fur family transcriptional regulator [Geomonas limicola]GFO69433.1 transcriptional repressor [Geomonas limicola]
MQRNAKEILRRYLAERGLKITRQRYIILEAFIELGRHLHVDEFYPILRAKYPKIGHATVYRSLKLFAESGIAREIRFGDGLTRYELVTEVRHNHLLCTACGTITEFESAGLGQLEASIVKDYGFKIQSLQIELRGVCSQCLESAPGALARDTGYQLAEL